MIYIIPFPLIDNEEINVNKKTRGLTLINAPSFWYLHGVLQDKFGYDGAYMFVDYETSKSEIIQTFNDRLYLAPGIYDVKVEGYDKPCKAYMWHKHEGDNILLRGLVVDPDDTEWVEDAERKYKEKPIVM